MKQTLEGDDDRIRFLEIEFIGGPYDGHKQPCFTQPVQLAADVVWLVCEDVFRLLDGKDRRPGGSITSVAFYELEAAVARADIVSRAPSHLRSSQGLCVNLEQSRPSSSKTSVAPPPVR